MSAPASQRSYGTAFALFLATFASLFFVGAFHEGTADQGLSGLAKGYTFALPFMAILVAHELGHFVVARMHGVETSPPYFLPFPLPPLGTLGAVIGMPPIERRNALLDVGAAGPITGLVVALGVLAYGLSTSPVEPPQPGVTYMLEGHSLLYEAMIYAIKGELPAGHDVMLNPTAFAGWAGLLVTMINLVPAGQLDGGHIAYAMFGARQDAISRRVRDVLVLVAIGVAAGNAARIYPAPQAELIAAAMAGGHWLLWAFVLTVMSRFFGAQHPATDSAPLTRARKLTGALCLALFLLLFMPTWLTEARP